MLVYALRALPVSAIAVLVLAVVGWFSLLNAWPAYLWPAAGIAAGVLGAGTSRLFDEPAAAVVDSLPRALWWRTAARSFAAGALILVWLAGVSTIDADRSGVHLGLLRLYGLGAVLTVAAICTGLRRRGRATPGAAVGSAFFLVLLFLATSNPLPHHLPLFPLVTDPELATSGWLWWGIVATAGGALAAFCYGGSPLTRPLRFV